MSTIYGYKGNFWKVVHDFQYTGDVQSVTLDPNKYLLICHGAQGGKTPTYDYINYGGVSMGVLDLKNTTEFKVYVGGNGGSPSGDNYKTPGVGGFNGGGNGGSSSNYGGAGGGGATDIRLYEDDGTMVDTGFVLPDLPDGYTYFRCIGNAASSHTAAFNTRYKVSTNTRIECETLLLSVAGTQCLFGSGHNTTDWYGLWVSQDGNDRALFFTGNYKYNRLDNTGLHDGKRVKIVATSTEVEWFSMDGTKINGITFTHPMTLTTSPGNLFLLSAADKSNNSKEYSQAYIYDFKIYESDTLAAHMIPCKRDSDGSFGFYDVVRNTFIVRANSSTLSYDEAPAAAYNKSLLSRIIVAGGGGGMSNCRLADANNTSSYCGMGGGSVGGFPSNRNAYPSQTSGYSFGIGMSAPDKVSGSSGYGISGAGGGWYGGYAYADTTANRSTAMNGGGGSGYVHTADSEKPKDILGEDYYLTDTYMCGGVCSEPRVLICTITNAMSIGDNIIYPCIGSIDHFVLPKGKYDIECYGGAGGCAYDFAKVAKGGYARGILNNPEYKDIYVAVGGVGIGSGFINSSYPTRLRPSLMFNGGGAPGANNIRGCAGGGGTDVRIGSDSLYSRIIVAGGGGGLGRLDSTAGAGGGETGGTNYGASYGTSPGPGTQTSSPQTSDQSMKTINGGFGYGGNGVYRNGGYGGAGGGGWHGGSGTYPDSGGDDDKAGNGGSGYVLTESSYKPDGYLVDDSRYYLSDTTLTTGGNTLSVWETKVTMKILDISIVKVLAHDDEGFKYFDEENNTWVFYSNELSVDDFTQHGVYSVGSDNGLLNNYSIIVNDIADSVNTMNATVSPLKQTIMTTAKTNNRIDEIQVDADYDESEYSVEVNGTRKGVGDDAQLELQIDIDKNTNEDHMFKLYTVNIITTGDVRNTRYIEPKNSDTPDEDGKTKALLKVGTNMGIPVYKQQYITTVNGAAVTSITSSVACEHNRIMYVGQLLNKSTLRFMQINLLTNKSKIIKEITYTTSYTNAMNIGGMLVDDNYIYYTSPVRNDTKPYIYRIDLNNPNEDPKIFTPGPSGSSYGYYNGINVRGKIQWFDDHTIVNGTPNDLTFFDTNTNSFKISRSGRTNSVNSRPDFIVGKKCVIYLRAYTSNSTITIDPYDVANDTWLPAISIPSGNDGYGCYDGKGKFYVASTSRLCVIDEETMTLVETISISWIRPQKVCYSKGIVYATEQGSNKLWMYNTSTRRFNVVVMPWILPSDPEGSNTYEFGITRFGVFEGYVFIPYYLMMITSYIDTPKFRFGGKYDQFKIMCNSQYEKDFTYDERFVTFHDTFMAVHDGVLSGPLLEYDGMEHVKYADMDKTAYKSLINISFINDENI